MKTIRNLAVDIRMHPDVDRGFLDETDTQIDLALRGDRDAAAYVAITFSSALLQEARDVLGRRLAHEAEDVVQQFCAELLEGNLYFSNRPGAGIAFLQKTVRGMAREVKRRKRAQWKGRRR
jgi:hypothetical protein